MTLLLAVTTPIGTGEGVHQDELLHPVFPHTHLVAGRIVSDGHLGAARSATLASPPVRGPAFGAGNGADAAGLGLAIGPALPIIEWALGTAVVIGLPPIDTTPPVEFRDTPEDPPPDVFA
jgi:hypothetical protein